jgi:hypothetical protein
MVFQMEFPFGKCGARPALLRSAARAASLYGFAPVTIASSLSLPQHQTNELHNAALPRGELKSVRQFVNFELGC